MNIYKKIFLVQNEIGNLIKDAVNKFQKYQYFTEYQLLKKLKPLLEKHRILILISDKSESLEYINNEKEYIIKYLKEIKFVNIDDSEELNFNFWAIGGNQDPAKAKGAAETYAMKYFLSKIFLIPVSQDEDPDSK